MVTADELLEKISDESVVFMDFAHKVAEYGETAVYCFIEDYDMPYYSNPLKYVIELKAVPIRCRGKSKVLEIHETLKGHPVYNKYTKRFFVDKDFDDNSSLDKDIYVTPGYSIENFYISSDCISQVITTEYDLDPVSDKEDFERLLGMYLRTRDSYNQAILEFNAWYSGLHSMNDWNHRGVYLGIEFPKNWVKIEWNGDCIQRYDIEAIEHRFPDAPKVNRDLLNMKKDELSANLPLFQRGKYQIEFFCKFIDFVTEDGSTTNIYNKKHKTVSATKDKAISQFSQYADVPESLIQYIRTGQRTA